MAEASGPSREWLRKRLEEADPDLLRAMVETVVATLMSAEADALCGAGLPAALPVAVAAVGPFRLARTIKRCRSRRPWSPPWCA